MGNQACCEDSRTQTTVLGDVHSSKSGIKPKTLEEEKRDVMKEPKLTEKAQITLTSEKFFFDELNRQVNPPSRRFDNDVYFGDLDEYKVKPLGFGRMYKPNGSIYIGYFQKGRAQGQGVFIFPDGAYYKGQFKNNRAEDHQGIYKSEVMHYVGGFKNNTFDGKATEEGRDYKFIGWYANGARQKGTLTWYTQGREYQYEGEFNIHNQFHGKGLLREPYGTYDGQFVNGEKEGQGEYRSTNGTIYKGQYKNGYREGEGTIFNEGGSVAYKGGMSAGIPHGQGSIYKNGKQVRTTWVEGIDQNLLPSKN